MLNSAEYMIDVNPYHKLQQFNVHDNYRNEDQLIQKFNSNNIDGGWGHIEQANLLQNVIRKCPGCKKVVTDANNHKSLMNNMQDKIKSVLSSKSALYCKDCKENKEINLDSKDNRDN